MKLKRFYARNKIIIIFITVIILFFLYYLYLHRHPRTQNAFVIANIRPVSSFVPGIISKIYVTNKQRVEKGDKLFDIYKKPYELKVDKIQGELEAAEYKVKALSSKLRIAKLNVKQETAKLENAEYLAKQAIFLSKDHAVAEKSAEKLDRARDVAETQLEISQTEFKAKQQELNYYKSRVSSLKAMLEEAKVNLSFTTVYAKSDGIISNMYITEGIFADQGKPLFSFINDEKWWIQANIKETELTNVKKGQRVWVKLWLYPNKVFEGVVSNIGWNVNRQKTSRLNFLPEVEKENEWFLLPQRFPVQIELVNFNPSKYPLHAGSTATVVIDTKSLFWKHIFWKINWW
ncbi:MAG: HlyD family secretion protein [Victivallales bacterium]|nr:HlyD family secretion protein [Victivallales bacterium]MCF7889541.1 HlyD family secretion protein [Victivallales bacterium]